MGIVSLPSAVGNMKSGRLRPIAVTSARRSTAAPQVPTLSESGAAGYDFASEWGLLLPAKVPQDTVKRLHAEMLRVLKAPDVVERLSSQGAEIIAMGPDEYTASIRASLAKWNKVVRAANIRSE